MKITVISGVIAAMMLFAAPSAMQARTASGRSSTLTPSKNIATEYRTSAMNFSKIEVSSIIKLKVENRTDNVIEIRGNENVLPYVDVSVSNNTLYASLRKVKFASTSNGVKLTIEIAIPNNGKIKSIKVSGASSVDVEPVVYAENFEAKVSGASKLSVDVHAEKSDFEISGASSMAFNCEGGVMTLEASGASSARGSANVIKSSIDVSGASTVHLHGKSDSSSIETSGASNFIGPEFRTEICSAKVSGAANAEVFCSRSLSAEASGMAKITYAGGCGLSWFSSSGLSKIRMK